jgi:RNA polymerase sigma-70 factor (ECF subfamily)
MRLRVDDEALAQDLTAATFEQALAHLDQLRSPEAFGGWLFRIARNQVAQHYRRRRAHVPLEAVADHVDDALSVEAQVERSQELTRLLAAIRTLSEREQEIIGLKFLGGLNNKQIGRAMGLRAGNVAVILYRSLRRLRDLLGEEERDA